MIEGTWPFELTQMFFLVDDDARDSRMLRHDSVNVAEFCDVIVLFGCHARVCDVRVEVLTSRTPRKYGHQYKFPRIILRSPSKFVLSGHNFSMREF